MLEVFGNYAIYGNRPTPKLFVFGFKTMVVETVFSVFYGTSHP